MTRTVIRPFSSRQPDPDVPGRFFENEVCQAIRAGDHVFVRGQAGQTLEGGIIQYRLPMIILGNIIEIKLSP